MCLAPGDLDGQRRYAHVAGLRGDEVAPRILQLQLQLDIGASMPQPKVGSTASRTSECMDCVMKHAQRWLP